MIPSRSLSREIVLLRPKRVCGILPLEILNQRSDVEDAGIQIACERRQPAAAEQPLAYRVGN